MSNLSNNLAEGLIRYRWPLLALAILAAVCAFLPAGKLDFDRSIENMFASDSEVLVPYRKLKQTFGGNEIVLAVYAEPGGLFHPSGTGLRRLRTVSERLREIPGVADALSLADVAVHSGKDGSILLDSRSALGERLKDLFEGYTHSVDGKTVAVPCVLEAATDSVSRRETIDQIRDVMSDLPDDLPVGMITGEPVMVVDGFRYVEQDGGRLGWTSTLLLGAVILLCFRSVRWVLIPLVVVQLTMLLTRALLVATGLQLSMVSSMLTAIVTVVGVATVVHVIVRYREARGKELTPRNALAEALRLLAVPIFWACITDAVGFAALCWSSVGPVHDFGIMMATGSLLVLVSVALVVPALVLCGKFDVDPRRMWGESKLEARLIGVIDWVEKRPYLLCVMVFLTATITAAGAVFLQVETDFTKNFRRDSEIVRSYEFVETRLGGAGVWDVMVPVDGELDKDFYQRIEKLEEKLRQIEVAGQGSDPSQSLTKVLSLRDADAAVSDVPLIRLLSTPGLRAKMLPTVMPSFATALIGEDPEGTEYLRIMLRAREGQPSEQKRRLIEEVTRVSQEAFPAETHSSGKRVQVTGFFVLLTHLISSTLADQWLTFGVALAGIGLMMVLSLRSVKLAVIALVPNVLPVLVVTGLWGWCGLKINMGAAMIAAVSLGLSIDSSIHYLFAFQRARREGVSVHDSLVSVQRTVGRAVVFSTIALIVGFAGLCLSQFVPTVYFGALVSLSMLGGLVGNLLVLPLLLTIGCKETGGDL